jgi:hypothetical protein
MARVASHIIEHSTSGGTARIVRTIGIHVSPAIFEPGAASPQMQAPAGDPVVTARDCTDSRSARRIGSQSDRRNPRDELVGWVGPRRSTGERSQRSDEPRSRRSFRSHLLLRSGNGNGPAIADAGDGAGCGEARQRIAEALVADAQLGSELGAADRPTGASEDVQDEAI